MQDSAAPHGRSGRGAALLFTLTIFLSASLLFVVQPMFAKMILPLLGGTPAVWTTCMLFFQACLLIGYAYAHVSSKWLGPRAQPAVHLALLLVPLLLLPLGVPSGWEPPTTTNPVAWLLVLLCITIGLPFVAVSTSSPLLQKWFASTGHPRAGDPYFLYAASNLGSMLALLAYPAVIEGSLRLADQGRAWSVGYVVLVLMLACCAIAVWLARPSRRETVVDPVTDENASPLSWSQRMLWVVLAFVPSSYLLGVTTYLTTDVAAVPLLWVVPLSLYLLSFILVFARRAIVPHRAWVVAMPIAIVAVMQWLLAGALPRPAWLVPVIHVLAFFIVAMVCHGELARRRPHHAHLTEYYLLMSVGGVLGGLFNAVLAPLLFIWPLEYPIAIVLGCLLMPARVLLSRDGSSARRITHILVNLMMPVALMVVTWVILTIAMQRNLSGPARALLAAIPMLACFLVRKHPLRFALCVGAVLGAHAFAEIGKPNLLLARRTFFGVHRVFRSRQLPANELFHGSTLHGRQHIDPATGRPLRDAPALTYYHASGPAGQVFEELFKRESQPPPRVALIGLGVGSLAAYGVEGTQFACYEIDPAVVWIAEQSGHFSYIVDARTRGARVDMVLGDARLTLKRATAQSYDLIVLDAFSGDSIPVHLLTHQAMDIYLDKLRDGGIIAVHASNQYLDLRPVMAKLAEARGYVCLCRFDVSRPDAPRKDGSEDSIWLVIARDRSDLGSIASDQRWRPVRMRGDELLWTDDRSDLIRIFK